MNTFELYARCASGKVSQAELDAHTYYLSEMVKAELVALAPHVNVSPSGTAASIRDRIRLSLADRNGMAQRVHC